MEKITIDAGWLNGHNDKQSEVFKLVYDILSADPKTEKTGHSLGSCQSCTTWDNGKFRLTWRVDSSD